MKIINSNLYIRFDPIVFKDVKPGMIFVDVGAFNGDTILRTLRRFSGLTVVGIEPLKSSFDAMVSNLSKLTETKHLVNKGCWCEKDTLMFRTSPKSTGGGSFKQYSHLGEHDFIEVDTLDNILEDLKIGSIDLLKIDTEACEPEVLMGFTKYKSGTQFHIECHQGNLDDTLDVLKTKTPDIIYVNRSNQRTGSLFGIW